MTSFEDTRAMAEILRNLQEKTEASINEAKSIPAESDRVSHIVNPDTRAMANILEKLEKSTRKTAVNLVEESNSNEDLKMAMTTSKTSNGVSIAGFEIVVEKQRIEGITKNFYSIKDTNNNVLHKDLSLFESAMSIVKRLMLNKQLISIDRIVELDKQYLSHLIESYEYKLKLKSGYVTEARADVYEAKQSLADEKMRIAKTKILKTL